MTTAIYPYVEMPGEDGNFAPACYVTFRVGAAASRELALLDSGASHTTLTAKVVRDLALQPDPTLPFVRVSGAVSESELACQYIVDVEGVESVFQRIKVHQTRRDYAIIGRDILDRIVLHLDGPRHEFYVDTPAVMR